jgi:two-component system sensor histidine kinase KdpD
MHDDDQRGVRAGGRTWGPSGLPPRGAAAYAGSAALIAATTGLAWAGRALLEVPDVEMLFVLAVLVAAVFLGRGPSIAAAALGVAAYDFFFVPPPFTLDVHDVRYLLTFAMMFGVGIVVSSLASRLREQTRDAEVRERGARAQFALSSALGAAEGEEDMAAAAVRFSAEAFGGSAALLRRSGETLSALAVRGESPGARVRAWAETALASGRPAGGPDGVLCLPLLSGVEPVAVLAVYPWAAEGERPDPFPLLEAVGRQVATALERARLAGEARRAELRATSERMRSDLLSAVSHDLRSPLAVITGAATALRDEEGIGGPARRELVESICEEAERMERLVGNLLDMTRLQAGEVSLRKDWLPVEEVAGSAIARLERQLADRPVAVDVAAAPPVLADAVLLEQALVNLLENAAKYTPPGTPIEVRAVTDGGAVAIEVADRGPGIPPGDEERIFDRFQRGVHPGVAGAGLGLAIARAIAQAHDGTLTAARRPGGGTVFRLALPSRGAPPPFRPGSPAGEAAPAGTEGAR